MWLEIIVCKYVSGWKYASGQFMFTDWILLIYENFSLVFFILVLYICESLIPIFQPKVHFIKWLLHKYY